MTSQLSEPAALKLVFVRRVVTEFSLKKTQTAGSYSSQNRKKENTPGKPNSHKSLKERNLRATQKIKKSPLIFFSENTQKQTGVIVALLTYLSERLKTEKVQMKKNSQKSQAIPAATALPYLRDLLPANLDSKEKKMISPMEIGLGDEEIATLVGCRNRAVRRFRESLGIPCIRQRAKSRSAPFAILQRFGFINATCFAVALIRRAPGLKIGANASGLEQYQSYSAASPATQALAELENLLSAHAKNECSGNDNLTKPTAFDLITEGLKSHVEVRKWLTFPAEKPPDESEHGFPISVILVAGREADAVQERMKTFPRIVIRCSTIREIVSYLNSSCLNLYGASLWLGLEKMLGQRETGLESLGYYSPLNAAAMLRLIDTTGIAASPVLGALGIAVLPPSLHIRQFARRDGFHFAGRPNRKPVIYTAKPWLDAPKRPGAQSVAYVLPYDILNSLHHFRSPDWLANIPEGLRTETRDNKRYLVARYDSLLPAVARAVRSVSFQKAIVLSTQRQSQFEVPLLADWCSTFWSRPADSKFFRNRKMDSDLTAIYALMTFEIDFLMRHFDRRGQLMVGQLEQQWRDFVANALIDFLSGLEDRRRNQCRMALRSFCELHRRPARFLLVCAKRRAEEICRQHVIHSDGSLARRLEILRTGREKQTRYECLWITETLKSQPIYTGFAIAENCLRNHFISYVSYSARTDTAARDFFETADRPREPKYSCGKMWDPERDNDDASDDSFAAGQDYFF